MESDSAPHDEPAVAGDAYGGREIKPNPYGASGRAANWMPQAATIVAGETKTFHVDWEPEFWHVVCLATPAATPARVIWYTGSAGGGPGIPMGGGGSAKQVPASMNSGDMTVVNIGSNPATVVAIAIYGLTGFDYDPGDLA